MSESLDTRLMERLFPASFQSSTGRHTPASPLLPFPLRPHLTAGGGGAAAGAPPSGNKVLGDPEITANLYCNFAYPYWECRVICSIYLR